MLANIESLFSRDSSRNHSHGTLGRFSLLQAYLVPVERNCKHIWSVLDLILLIWSLGWPWSQPYLVQRLDSSPIFLNFSSKICFLENHSFYVVYQLLYKQFHHLICFQIQHKMVFYIFQGITFWFLLDSWFWILLDFLSKLHVKVPKLNCLDSEGLAPEIKFLFRELWLADGI